MTDLKAIGVAVGPGSFTALRVGLAMAKGLALARGLAILGVPTLDVLATGSRRVICTWQLCCKPGRNRIAVGWYKMQTIEEGEGGGSEIGAEARWISQGKPEIMTVDALAKSIARPSIVAGELTTDERQRLSRKRVNVVLAPLNRCVRRPSLLAEMAWERFRVGQSDDLATLAPIYLHRPELTQV